MQSSLRKQPTITDRESRSVEKYIKEVAKFPLITAEEEVTLAQQIKSKEPVISERAFEKLVCANLRFVISVAKEYQNLSFLKLPDLINEGNYGLIKAARRFDETKGFKFLSYAIWWIKQSILQAIAEQGRLVRLPQNKIAEYSEISLASSEFLYEHKRSPTIEELHKITAIRKTTIRFIMQENANTSSRHVSLDEPLDDTSDETLGHTLVSELLADDELNNTSFRNGIHRIIRTVRTVLSERQAEILIAYYGLDGDRGPTLNQVIDTYGISVERQRQIREKAIDYLKENKKSIAMTFLD